MASRDIDIYHLNINDRDSVISLLNNLRPDEIYHLAAISETNANNINNYYKVNFEGTLNLYESIKKVNFRTKVLYVGSAYIYGHQPSTSLPINESNCISPMNDYAVSKAAADLLSFVYYCKGLNIIRVRPFNHTGPGQSEKFLCPRIAREVVDIKKGIKNHLFIGNLENRRDFTDVRDVVRAYWLLMQHGRPGEAYNVCSSTSYSVNDIVGALEKIAQIKLNIKQLKELVRKNDIPALIGNYSKIQADTGWKPIYSLEETLTDLYNSIDNDYAKLPKFITR